MKPFDWNEAKNEQLKNQREVCFEDVATAIHDGKLLVTLNHPNKTRYPNQKIYVINIQNYAYMVPFVEDKEKIFLKTVIPSRKMTKKYLLKEKS